MERTHKVKEPFSRFFELGEVKRSFCYKVVNYLYRFYIIGLVPFVVVGLFS